MYATATTVGVGHMNHLPYIRMEFVKGSICQGQSVGTGLQVARVYLLHDGRAYLGTVPYTFLETLRGREVGNNYSATFSCHVSGACMRHPETLAKLCQT